MTKSSIDKLDFLLSGVIARLDENLEFFNEIKVLYKSGLKEFPMDITYSDNKFSCSFMGAKKEILKEEIANVILKELDKFDSVLIIYTDRINTIELTADNKRVNSKIKDSVKRDYSLKTAAVGGREYIIKENEAQDLLKAIGIMADNNKIKNDMIRKYNQIDRFIELISDIDFNDNITILDCACGKSYLSFVLNFYYTQIKKKKCHVIGIDYNEGVIDSSEKMAKSLNYNNMEFIRADLSDFNLERKVDLTVSLHACDTATDYAIYSGIKHNSKAIICVPCCHKELADQIEYDPFSNIFKHGIFKRKFSDILTDSLRVLLLESFGYKVSVIEYTSPLDTPKNIMIKACKVSDFNNSSKSEYEKLKNMFKVNPILESLLNNIDNIRNIW